MTITQDWMGALAHVAKINGFSVEADEAVASRCYLVKPGHEAYRIAVKDPGELCPGLDRFSLNLWASVVLCKAARQLSWFTFKPDLASDEWDNRRWVDRMI